MAAIGFAAPPVINLLTNINAGTIIAGTGGTVSLSLTSNTPTVGGGVSLHGTAGASRGRFSFSGTRNNRYALAFASANPATLSGSNGGSMTAAVTESAALTGTFPANTINCFLGVTITVGPSASTPAGTYSGSISMRVTDTTVLPNQSTTQSFSITVKVDPGITLTRLTSLRFGDLFAGAALGTVVIPTTGPRTKTGGVTLLTFGSSSSGPATFAVGGAPGATYGITVPTSITLTNTSSSATLLVNSITRTPAGTGTLSAGGTQTLTIGGTLRVAANQADGDYVGSFNVTVTYN